jgi:DnaJ-class molecular chaperone
MSKCQACNGTGYFYHKWEEPCGVIPSDCDGAGSEYWQEREHYEVCDECGGLGEIDD